MFSLSGYVYLYGNEKGHEKEPIERKKERKQDVRQMEASDHFITSSG